MSVISTDIFALVGDLDFVTRDIFTRNGNDDYLMESRSATQTGEDNPLWFVYGATATVNIDRLLSTTAEIASKANTGRILLRVSPPRPDKFYELEIIDRFYLPQ